MNRSMPRRSTLRPCAVVLALMPFILMGCDPSERPAIELPKERPEVFAEPVPDMPQGHPDLPSLQIASRAPRRLSITQLERSLDVIGNLPPGTVRLPPDLAITLGRPDFNRVTEESLEPSPLFMKFMVDLGAFVCSSLGDYEPQRPATERLMTRYGGDVDQNLRFMLLRFTGIEGAAADAHLVRLRAAYDRGAQSSTRALGGYEAACIALFTSPEFLLY